MEAPLAPLHPHRRRRPCRPTIGVSSTAGSPSAPRRPPRASAARPRSSSSAPSPTTSTPRSRPTTTPRRAGPREWRFDRDRGSRQLSRLHRARHDRVRGTALRGDVLLPRRRASRTSFWCALDPRHGPMGLRRHPAHDRAMPWRSTRPWSASTAQTWSRSAGSAPTPRLARHRGRLPGLHRVRGRSGGRRPAGRRRERSRCPLRASRRTPDPGVFQTGACTYDEGSPLGLIVGDTWLDGVQFRLVATGARL